MKKLNVLIVRMSNPVPREERSKPLKQNQKETRERKTSFEDSRRRETERAEAFRFENKPLKFSSLTTSKVHLFDMKQFLTSPGSLYFDEKASIGTFPCGRSIPASSTTIETEV